MAQTSDEFPPAKWVGEFRVTYSAQPAGGSVSYEGAGGFEVEGQGSVDPPGTNVGGTLEFAVRVRARSELGRSDRVYTAEWDVNGLGSNVSAQGLVDVIGNDSALVTEPDVFAEVPVEFTTDGHGELAVAHASCASVSGTFTTGIIKPPGSGSIQGDPGVAFIAPFVAFPGDRGPVNEVLSQIFPWVDEFRTILSEWDSENPPNGVEMADRLREIIALMEVLNQKLADLQVCQGLPAVISPGGVLHSWLAELLRGTLENVLDNPTFFSAAELIDFYWLGANMSAFAIPGGAAIQDQFPERLSEKLFEAITKVDVETIEVIHAAACQWGWTDLKEESTP